MYRVEWIRHQEREKKKLEDEKEKERGKILLCTCNWHVLQGSPVKSIFNNDLTLANTSS